ncbi:MAG TPA: S8 family peptidase [Symbiobacteriaceae bacterium]
MHDDRAAARSRLVCLKDAVDLPAFIDLAGREGVHHCVPIPLMGGFGCVCDERAEAWLAGHPSVVRVEEDIPISLTGIWSRHRGRQPLEMVPEGLRLIRAPQAWTVSEGAGVSVAVIDTGIDHQHPDLAPNIAGGINLVIPGALPQDVDGHGTAIAGVVGAARMGRGMAGIAPKARLYAVKAVGSDGASALSTLLLALQWVVDQQIPVANMSLGTPSYSLAFERTVSGAVARGLTLVAAAGNEGRVGRIDYPAGFPGVLAVTAIDQSGGLAPFCNTGSAVALAAPGVQVFSTRSGGGYVQASGTSFATPHVTGVAALYRCLHPEATPARVREALMAAAIPLPLGPEQAGAGRVDAWNAVHAD